MRNDGLQPIHLGNVTDPNNAYQKAHVFEFSPCHMHYHFSHYGSFSYNGSPGSKRAFCLEDTNRYHNDEFTALGAPHQTCEFQGINPGWGDEYNFGLPGQWVDITNVDTTQPHDLVFQSNPDQMLCEGQTLDANNQPVDPTALDKLVFDPTPFRSPDGSIEGRVRCSFPSNWNANNTGKVSYSSPGGSFVTDACKRGQTGPKRDCGYAARCGLPSCSAGSTVSLHCSTSGPPAVLRVCERSAQLGTGVACTYRQSSANAIVDGRGATISFLCPTVRDSSPAGQGGYSTYQAPLLPGQPATPIHCTP